VTVLEGKEPQFLTREEVDELHRRSIEKHGGAHGLRNEHGLESAIAQPLQLYAYTQADHFDIAGAYAYHLAESQAYIDGNKRVAISAATTYLELNGIDTSRLPEQKTYEAMIDISARKMDRAQAGDFLRSHLKERPIEQSLAAPQLTPAQEETKRKRAEAREADRKSQSADLDRTSTTREPSGRSR
jgi:death-on-curing protein